MSKKELLKKIEDGLLSSYLDKDYSNDRDTLADIEEIYEGQSEKYRKLIKQILFKSKTHIQKVRVARVISIAEASGRLQSLKDKDKENVFSIFKKHVDEYGLAANYRNFDKMTKEEMSNILEQLDLTALFDEIDASSEDE